MEIRRVCRAVGEEPVREDLSEPAQEDGEAGAGGDGDAPREDVVVAMLDATEEVVVDGDEDPESGAGIGVDEGQEQVAGFVTVFGTFCEAFEELALVEGEVRAVAEGGEFFDADAVAVEVFEGKVDAAAFGVFADVPENVGELEGDAGVLGKLFGARVGVAEDADADQADDGGDVVAVLAEVFEGGVGVVARAGTGVGRAVEGSVAGGGRLEGRIGDGIQGGVEIHGGAADQLVEEIHGDVEAELGVGESDKDGVFSESTGGGAVPFIEPGVEVFATLGAWAGFVVGDIVGVTHEGVDGADGVALRLGESEEGVVEVLRLTAGDGGAFLIGGGELEIGEAKSAGSGGGRDQNALHLLARARSSRAALRVLEMAGRARRTSKF